MRALLLPSLAALAVQPVVFLLHTLVPQLLAGRTGPVYGLATVVVSIVLFAAAHLLFLGIPAFLFMRNRGRATAARMTAAGFVCGLPFIAVLGWPSRYGPGVSGGSTWHGEYREMLVNGVPTVWAWLSYAEGLAFFGLQGATGGLAFYAVWLKLRPNNSSKPTPLRGAA